MNLWMLKDSKEYKRCGKSKLNFLKNPARSGTFYTKANRSGWRYYAHIPGLDKSNDGGRGASGA